jgi:tetratricopeptide (TPR) repeat protein
MKRVSLTRTRNLAAAIFVASGVACSTSENATSTNEVATTNSNIEVAHSSSRKGINTAPQDSVGGNAPHPAGQGRASGASGSPENSAPRSPGGTPIDTAADDAEIKRLEQIADKRKGDAQARLDLARAYAARASRLTQAAQYRSALGDWRRATKLDPSNEEAQNMIATITSIFQQLNREPPAPGEEPPPLPFKKG